MGSNPTLSGIFAKQKFRVSSLGNRHRADADPFLIMAGSLLLDRKQVLGGIMGEIWPVWAAVATVAGVLVVVVRCVAAID